MQRRSLATGEMLMRKGDPADRVFYLAKGTVEITELGKAIEPGSIIGEIGIFSPHQKRTASAICRSDCSLYELSMSQVKRLYFQNPSFGYAVLQLIIVRLLENQDLMQRPAATT
jgi:CRP-like cAMP-binding protein